MVIYEALLNWTLDAWDWLDRWTPVAVVLKYVGALVAGGIITVIFSVTMMELAQFIAVHTN